MSTLAQHFKNVLYSNFDPYREPLKVKFTGCGSDRLVQPFSIQYLDGFTKGLICQAIVALVDSMVSQLCIVASLFLPIPLPDLCKNHGKKVELATSLLFGFYESKGLEEEELESDDLKPLLVSLKYLKAQYTHQNSEAAFIYEALRPEPSSLLI